VSLSFIYYYFDHRHHHHHHHLYYKTKRFKIFDTKVLCLTHRYNKIGNEAHSENFQAKEARQIINHLKKSSEEIKNHLLLTPANHAPSLVHTY